MNQKIEKKEVHNEIKKIMDGILAGYTINFTNHEQEDEDGQTRCTADIH